jgi:hypothetical protein
MWGQEVPETKGKTKMTQEESRTLGEGWGLDEILFDVESHTGFRLVVGPHGVAVETPEGALEWDRNRKWTVRSHKTLEGKEGAVVREVVPPEDGMTGEELSDYLRDFDVISVVGGRR